MLKLLASQAAIALEIARLYRDLEQRQAKIRRLVDANIIGIFFWDLGGGIIDANDTFAFVRAVGFDQTGEPGVLRNFSIYTISPIAWAGALAVAAIAILAAARTRWGWAVAVTLATLAPPRLLTYMLTSLLAGIRQPKPAGERDPNDLADAASAFVRASR